MNGITLHCFLFYLSETCFEPFHDLCSSPVIPASTCWNQCLDMGILIATWAKQRISNFQACLTHRSFNLIIIIHFANAHKLRLRNTISLDFQVELQSGNPLEDLEVSTSWSRNSWVMRKSWSIEVCLPAQYTVSEREYRGWKVLTNAAASMIRQTTSSSIRSLGE